MDDKTRKELEAFMDDYTAEFESLKSEMVDVLNKENKSAAKRARANIMNMTKMGKPFRAAIQNMRNG